MTLVSALALDAKCLCGTEKKFEDCCHIYLNGKLAPDPEVLMRSRYTAFSICDFNYLKKTWHPDTLPEELEDDEPNDWIGLEIIDAYDEDDEGEVEFKAKLLFGGKLEVLHERSHFDRIDGVWLYHSGEFLNDGKNLHKIKKNEDCPCGSGKTFKNCHANK